MKRIYTIIFVAAALLSACEEFQPVFTGKYPLPEYQLPEVLEPTHTIAQLAELYKSQGVPVEITEDIVIAGSVHLCKIKYRFFAS